MAKVKFPLFSLSATGKVGDVLLYHRVAKTPARTMKRRYANGIVEAKYPARIISGRGVVRKRPSVRYDKRRRHKIYDEPASLAQATTEYYFKMASAVAHWVIKHNLVVAAEDPADAVPFLAPWSDGVYFLRGENRENIEFPGHPVGMTTSARRQLERSDTKLGFIMRELLSRKYVRVRYLLGAWVKLSAEDRLKWLPGGNAPWDALPAQFTLPRGSYVGQDFINAWIQSSYLIPRYELLKGWLQNGDRLQVWHTPYHRPSGDPMVIAWKNHIGAENDFTEVQSTPWQPRDRG